jgi:hypothetical protein
MQNRHQLFDELCGMHADMRPQCVHQAVHSCCNLHPVSCSPLKGLPLEVASRLHEPRRWCRRDLTRRCIIVRIRCCRPYPCCMPLVRWLIARECLCSRVICTASCWILIGWLLRNHQSQALHLIISAKAHHCQQWSLLVCRPWTNMTPMNAGYPASRCTKCNCTNPLADHGEVVQRCHPPASRWRVGAAPG